MTDRGAQPIGASAATLVGLLDAARSRLGDAHELLTFPSEDRRVTLGGLAERAGALANRLRLDGVARGDAVCLVGTADSLIPVAQLACAQLGCRLAVLNPRSSARELRSAVARSGARFVVVTAADEGIHAADDADALVALLSAGAAAVRLRWDDLDRLVRPGDPVAAGTGGAADAGEVALIQFTSGSTGAPKGVLLSHRGVVSTAVLLAEVLELTPEDVIFNPAPFFHISGTIALTGLALASGARMVVPERVRAGEALRLLATEGCTGQVGQAATFIAQLNHPDFDRSQLTAVRKGWVAGSERQLRRVHDEMGLTGLVQPYGMSETSTVTCGRPTDPLDKRLRTCGRPLRDSAVAVVEEGTSRRVPSGTVGEILLRGPGVMVGYLDDPASTAAVVDAEGWVRSGDLGFVDHDGFLQVSGRLKETIRRGGENVSPREIEEALDEHVGVAQVAVVPAPDDRLGEAITAFVVPDRHRAAGEAVLREHLALLLAPFKAPDSFLFVDELPLTATGKVDKAHLRIVAAGDADPRAVAP